MSTVYEVVTNRIIEMLEGGVVPWAKPWRASVGAPRSLVSQRAYRGINVLLTGAQGFESPYWLTYRQAKELGAHARQGERATPVVFFTKLKGKEGENGQEREIPLLRYYSVFNVAQIEGLNLRRELLYPTAPTGSADPIEAAEEIVNGYADGPEIKSGFVKAAYSPSSDLVMMPRREAFAGAAEYYSTLFHELTHSTAAEKRLNRDSLRKIVRFGDHDYSREELVAEIGSAMLCAEAGISERVIENQAAYINGWLKTLKGDARAVVFAGAQAQKAVELITGRSQSVESDGAPRNRGIGRRGCRRCRMTARWQRTFCFDWSRTFRALSMTIPAKCPAPISSSG